MSEGAQELASRLVIALVVALAFSPVIRGITIELNQSLGRTWPFVLERCRTEHTPGCSFAEPTAALGFRHLVSG